MAHASRNVLILASALVAVAVFNLVVVSGILSEIGSGKEKAAAESAEILRPANISLLELGVPDCPDCYSIGNVVDSLKSANVNVIGAKTINYTSPEAKELIQKYGIKKVPALIISGEVDKSNAKGALSEIGEAVDGAVVFSNPQPVYIDLSSGNAVGRVSATVISADLCTQCRNMSEIIAVLKANGIAIQPEKTYDYTSPEAKAIISKYNITMAPALLFSKDLEAYASVVLQWASAGIASVEQDGTYVIRAPLPPYIDIPANKLRGIVSAINIVDESCSDCYDVALHKGALRTYGINFSSETTYDAGSSEGKALVSKYNITRVPTIILSSEAGVYPQLVSVWSPSLGSVEKDGSYVFRAVDLMGAYKDLASNKTISKSS